VGQSGGNRGADLERAIANVTRMLGATDDPKAAADLVKERAAMRAELAQLAEDEARWTGKVVALAPRVRASDSR
jgi:hypothetical protein